MGQEILSWPANCLCWEFPRRYFLVSVLWETRLGKLREAKGDARYEECGKEYVKNAFREGEKDWLRSVGYWNAKVG